MQVGYACLPDTSVLSEYGLMLSRPAHQKRLHFYSNDMADAPKRRRSLEVLIRKLLALPSSPALVYLHWWSPTTNQVCQNHKP